MDQKSKKQTNETENDKSKSGCCPFLKKAKTTSNSALYKCEFVSHQSKVAFTCDIPKEILETGKAICLSGQPQQTCSRFSVNLLCGKDSSSDIAFHLNPRLVQRYIVRNSRQNGEWKEEETASIWKFPFQRNKKFDLNIFIADGEFLISLDGKHICSFNFRMPLSKITTIEVNGPVEVYGVEYKNVKIYPEPSPENKPFIVAEGLQANDVTETAMDMPITALLPEGLKPNWALEISGRVKMLPHSFYINLQESSQYWPHPIVHLHLNPRFCTSSGEYLFVRNSWIDGSWGQEERVPNFQFTPGSFFTMAIQRGSDHFSVWIDGKLTGEFKFRCSPDKIDTLYILGDVIIYSISINKDPSTLTTSQIH